MHRILSSHEQSSESYDAQRFIGTIKGKAGKLSFNLDDTFAYIDGSDMGPTYPGAFISVYNTATGRERHQQSTVAARP